ncbi:MAG TPA: helix-turn-helix domain-containing protein [Arachidicoccus sp.]|nr:helix-turn-helix domain-containing protein [Arachidicoccus sp.]
MQTMLYMPHFALRPYIQIYMHSNVGGEGQRMELDLFPVGHSVMTFILNENHFLHNTTLNKYFNVRFNFTGQLNHYHHLITSPASMIYVMFKPFGAFRLLGIPQHLLVNECVLVSDILGGVINDLCQQMEDRAHSPKDVISLLEQWLLKQLKKSEKPQTERIALACQNIIFSGGNLPINELYRLTNMSKSSLEQHFKEQVGLSLKTFSRVIRFNRVNKFLIASATKDWQELVYRYGYFDQAHFIHEFKHFFGYSPSQIHLSHQNLASHVLSLEGNANDSSL